MANVATRKAAKVDDAPAVVAGRMAPVIPPANMKIDSQGQMLRRFIVRLPEGFTRSDLMETEGPWRRDSGEQLGAAKARRTVLHRLG